MGCCTSRGGDRAQPPIVTVSNNSRASIQKLESKKIDMERFVQSQIAKGQPWTDPDFPPEAKSLYDPRIDQVDQDTYAKFSWKRAS